LIKRNSFDSKYYISISLQVTLAVEELLAGGELLLGDTENRKFTKQELGFQNILIIIQFNSIQFFIINVPSQQQNANYRNSTV
jgi:hypothetical protein